MLYVNINVRAARHGDERVFHTDSCAYYTKQLQASGIWEQFLNVHVGLGLDFFCLFRFNIYLFFSVSLDHFFPVLLACVVFGLVSSVSSQELGWEECLLSETQSINQASKLWESILNFSKMQCLQNVKILSTVDV